MEIGVLVVPDFCLTDKALAVNISVDEIGNLVFGDGETGLDGFCFRDDLHRTLSDYVVALFVCCEPEVIGASLFGLVEE